VYGGEGGGRNQNVTVTLEASSLVKVGPSIKHGSSTVKAKLFFPTEKFSTKLHACFSANTLLLT
jgi:hypothetical protein